MNTRPSPADDTPGLPARRAALKMLDAVMRRGESLDVAQHAACQGIEDRSDRALAMRLLQGGRRKLAHGVFGSMMRAGVALPAPELPPATANRWTALWGEAMAEAASAAPGSPPPLDLSLADASATAATAAQLGGTSLAPGHVRLPRAGAIEQIDGFESGDWWVQDLAAS